MDLNNHREVYNQSTSPEPADRRNKVFPLFIPCANNPFLWCSIFRLLCVVSGLTVFAGVTFGGWRTDWTDICLYNNYVVLCHLGATIGALGAISAVVLLLLDWDCIPHRECHQVGTNKRFLVTDFIVSGVWGVIFMLTACILTIQWSKSVDPPLEQTSKSYIRVANTVAMLGGWLWLGCALNVWFRLRELSSSQFAALPQREIGPLGYTEHAV